MGLTTHFIGSESRGDGQIVKGDDLSDLETALNDALNASPSREVSDVLEAVILLDDATPEGHTEYRVVSLGRPGSPDPEILANQEEDLNAALAQAASDGFSAWKTHKNFIVFAK